MNRRFSTAAISAATALTVTFAGISPVTAAPAAADTANTQTQPGSSSKNNQTPDLGKDEFGNPYRDYSKSSINPLIESSSEGIKYRNRKVTDQEYIEHWNYAAAMGHYSPLIQAIYKLQYHWAKKPEQGSKDADARKRADEASIAETGQPVSDKDWERNKNDVRNMYIEEREEVNGVETDEEGNRVNAELPGKVRDKEGSSNEVLASSLKHDTARGQGMGVTLDWIIAGTSIAIVLGAVAALNHFGMIKLPQF